MTKPLLKTPYWLPTSACLKEKCVHLNPYRYPKQTSQNVVIVYAQTLLNGLVLEACGRLKPLPRAHTHHTNTRWVTFKTTVFVSVRQMSSKHIQLNFPAYPCNSMLCPCEVFCRPSQGILPYRERDEWEGNAGGICHNMKGQDQSVGWLGTSPV